MMGFMTKQLTDTQIIENAIKIAASESERVLQQCGGTANGVDRAGLSLADVELVLEYGQVCGKITMSNLMMENGWVHICVRRALGSMLKDWNVLSWTVR